METRGVLINKLPRGCVLNHRRILLPLTQYCSWSTNFSYHVRNISYKKCMYPAQGWLIENKSLATWKQNIRRVNLRVNLRLKTFISFFGEHCEFRMHKQNL